MPVVRVELARLDKDFPRCERGNVALIFALALLAILASMGLAVDYARARNAQTMLQLAADAAALAAAKNPDLTDAQAVGIAQATMSANGSKPIIVGPITSTVKRAGGADPSVAITMATTLPTTFAAAVGFKTMPIAVSSKAGSSLTYSTVYAVIDMSASMGLAADPAARTALTSLTSPYYTGGCMFACHQRDGWEPAGKTVYQMARENGIALREDVLNGAFGQFANIYLDPTDPAVASGRRLLGVYGFSDSARLLIAPTNSSSSAKAALSTFPAASRLNTDFVTSLDTVRFDLGTQGNGTPANPRKTVLLITDGLAFNRATLTGSSINLSTCNNIKAAGYTLAVIEVKYQDATGEPVFDSYVSATYPKLSPDLQACASSGFYFQATDSDASSLAQTFAQAGNLLRQQLALTH